MAASAPARTGAPPARRVPALHRPRTLLATVLLVLGCLLAPPALATGWARAELTDTARYTATTAPLSRDPAVQRNMVTAITDGVMRRVDLSSLVDAVPPADRPAVRERFTRGIREFVATQIRGVVTSRSFPALWSRVNGTTHASLVTALASPGDRSVVLDLQPVVDRARARLVHTVPAGARLIQRVHVSGTTLVLLRSDEVAEARGPYAAVRTLGRLLPVAAVLSLAAGLLLAPRRRRALIGTGLGCAAGGVLLLAAFAAARGYALDALPPAVTGAAGSAVYDTLTASARLGGGALLATGLTAGCAAVLSGVLARRVRARRALRGR
ncbi:hypothetical protein [Streptomyces ochraceiscleroticus]|uniref:Integral membrane protein n=1 Tax=Streptomyces ochraceiscleroticus TaxID=47761 RepID=A0ABW1MQ36_9ACTN|nr:hypothetical protein [Streptomyces ochraceiscleroticus]